MDSRQEDKNSQNETSRDGSIQASITRETSTLGSESGEKSDGRDPSQVSSEYPRGIKLAAIVVALIISIFLVSLDQTIVATAIPKITDDFHGLDRVAWYGSIFFTTQAGFQSTWGKGYKFFSMKTTFLSSVIVFEIGSLLCGVAPNSTAL